MAINDNELIKNTSFLGLKEVEKDGKKYIYGELHNKLTNFELTKYQKVANLGIDGILSPVKFTFEDGRFEGYYMDYVDGTLLSQIIDTIPYDNLVSGIETLSEAYLKMAEGGKQLTSMELSDLMYIDGKLVHIGVDGFADAQSSIISFVHFEIMNVLKEKLIKQFSSMPLPPEVLKVLAAASKRTVKVEKMLRDFKEAVKLSYDGLDLKTLSELRGKNGNKEKTFGNSGANRGW